MVTVNASIPNYMNEKAFKDLHQELQLSHHPYKRSLLYLKWAFKDIDFKGKKVLDIGGGNGIYSYYAKLMGAAYCLNLEPFGAGSGNIKILGESTYNELKIDIEPLPIQEFNTDSKFDVIILHDSINHLDEEIYTLIHKDADAYKMYSEIIAKIYSLTSENGRVVVADCSRINFFASLGIRNPFAPTIDWHLHQHPPLLIKLFAENGFNLVKLRWSPFKRFDKFGQVLAKIGFPIAYFMQSHFNIVFSK